MYCLSLSREDWLDGRFVTIGQIGSEKVVETDTWPACPYIDITESDTLFNQRAFHVKFGDAVSYQTFLRIKRLLDEFGTDAASFEELMNLKIEQQEIELAELRAAVIELDLGG